MGKGSSCDSYFTRWIISVARYWESKSTCPKCKHKWSEGFEPGHDFKLKKVDFIWINREQKAFEWFLQLLSQLEIEQAEYFGQMKNFLDIHLYITSVLPASDFKAVTLHLALDLMHKKVNPIEKLNVRINVKILITELSFQTKRDLITGLKTRTKSGRPDWDKVFKKVQDEKMGKVTVFYCGNPILAKTLLRSCNDFGFAFKKEIF